MTISPDIEGPNFEPQKPAVPLPRGSCDVHAHVFGDPDIYPLSRQRQYTPWTIDWPEYKALVSGLGFSRAVLIQPSVYGTDNALLCDVLKSTTGDPEFALRGVAVAHDDMSDRELTRLFDLGIRAIRINTMYRGVQWTDNSIRRLAEAVRGVGGHLEFLLQLGTDTALVNTIADVDVECVIDHWGNIPASQALTDANFERVVGMMREGRLWMKLSGAPRISQYARPPFHDVDAVAGYVARRAPERLLYGTNWPHVDLTRDRMPDDGRLIDEVYRWYSGDADLIDKIFRRNPEVLYGF